MSPFHDLGRHCGGPLSTGRDLPSSDAAPPTGGRSDVNADIPVTHLLALGRVLLVGLLGLAGLLSLGVGGAVLVQSSVLRESKAGIGERASTSRNDEKSRSSNARGGSGSSAETRLEVPRLGFSGTVSGSLDGLRTGDVIRLTTSHTTHLLRVESMNIGAPDHADLIWATPRAQRSDARESDEQKEENTHRR